MRVPELGRLPALTLLALVTALGAVFRFTNIGWGAPYFHFHMDEHYVFTGAELLRRNPEEAAMAGKFFMYSPGPMYAVNVIRAVYEWFSGAPLDLARQGDQVTYMILGRSYSAFIGTLTIPLVYAVASRAAGRLAGVFAAFLLACSVIHIRESHFFTVDASLSFFSIVALYAMVRIVQRGGWSSDLAAGVALGFALLSKYTAVFLGPLIGVAQLLSAQAPRTLRPLSAWRTPVLRTVLTGVVGVVTFLLLDPLVILYFDKFLADIRDQVTQPLLGLSQPVFFAHFTGVSPRPYWFTNLLWWGLGPAFEIAGIVAVLWLLIRRDRVALMLAAFPIVFYLVAGRSVAPFTRYAVPLAPALAIAVGVASRDWLSRARVRLPVAVALLVVLSTTALWAAAYMNVYTTKDARLQASDWLLQHVPRDAAILVEPTHNTPPMGTYRYQVDFFGDHVIWGAFGHPSGEAERHDYYRLYALDVYRYLYNAPLTHAEQRAYIERRLALVDWIVIDDTYLQWYTALPADRYGGVRQYYEDLFGGRLGFEQVETFKVYPSLFGREVNDDKAELTFRLFDHPRIFIFRRIRT